jgi:hypothetical protein
LAFLDPAPGSTTLTHLEPVSVISAKKTTVSTSQLLFLCSPGVQEELSNLAAPNPCKPLVLSWINIFVVWLPDRREKGQLEAGQSEESR